MRFYEVRRPVAAAHRQSALFLVLLSASLVGDV
jgi:hypothetical protein